MSKLEKVITLNELKVYNDKIVDKIKTKANTSEVYDKTTTDSKFDAVYTKISEIQGGGSTGSTDCYTKTESDNKFLAKDNANLGANNRYLIGETTVGTTRNLIGVNTENSVQVGSTSANVAFSAASEVRPLVNNSIKLGSSTKLWKEIHGIAIYQNGKQVANKEDIPNKTSQLTNDSGYVNESYFNEKVEEVNQTSQEAKNIALGKAKAVVFDTVDEMTSYLKNATKDEFKIGDNLYIRELNVPDYWISTILDNSSGTYGYYEIAQLETQKVDLSNYQTKNLTTNININGVEESTLEGAINKLNAKSYSKTETDTLLNTKVSTTLLDNASGVQDIGWTHDDTTNPRIATANRIAHWNGAYDSAGASNLKYCEGGLIASHNDLANYVPTKTSQLTNDSGFLTSHITSIDGLWGGTLNSALRFSGDAVIKSSSKVVRFGDDDTIDGLAVIAKTGSSNYLRPGTDNTMDLGCADGEQWKNIYAKGTIYQNGKQVANKVDLTDGSIQVGAIKNTCDLGDSGLCLDDVFDLEYGRVYNSNLSQLSLNLQTYKIDVNAKSVKIYNAGLYSVELTSTVNAGYGNAVVLVSVEDMTKTYFYPFHYDVSTKGSTTAKAEKLMYSSSDKTISLFWDTSTSWTIKRIRLITEYTYGV